ncbi:MAG: histidine kinase [Flexilinea sp.]|nr:histidine kinase [Flexilinea sp.]
MSEIQLQNLFIALLLPVLTLIGLGIAVGSDPYLRSSLKRTILLIEAIVLSLIIDNNICIAITETWKPEYVTLNTLLDVYSYAMRPVVIVLFIYTVWDDPRRRFFWIPVGINAAVYMTAIVKPWTFFINPDGLFYRGPLGYTAHWVSGFLLFSMLILMLKLRAREGGKAAIIPLTNVIIAALGPVLDAQFHQNGFITFTELTTVYCCVFYYIWLHQQYVREHEQALKDGQRVQLMLSQIKPHFLHNALTVIVGLCDIDANRAKQATLKFARYLRGNMDSIEATEPIPFEKELEHTRLYLDIEKLRFGEALDVHYDITCTDFSVPALTVEPLAENAVRHGVRENPGGRGTVTIATREFSDHFEVTVTDDGPGFDPARLSEDKNNHVGIANVRERVVRVCHGTLTFDTASGRGTTARILIPKEEEKDKC